MPNPAELIDRKTFFRRASGLLAFVVFDHRLPPGSQLQAAPSTHPDPRPDITAERVLSAEALGTSRKEKVLAAYEAARAYPQLFDGLSCACGCTGKHGSHRSLLVCYETLQPTGCMGCQEEAQLVAKLAKDGKDLTEIRQAVDKAFD